MLVGRIGLCKVNILAIGKSKSWIVNARTAHARHFIGTELSHGLTRRAKNHDVWRKLEAFVLRYAAPGSLLPVFCLHDANSLITPVTEVTKQNGTLFQPSGCTLPGKNGILLASHIQAPIPEDKLDAAWLLGWQGVKALVQQRLAP